MLSDKCNLIMAKATGLVFSLLDATVMYKLKLNTIILFILYACIL